MKDRRWISASAIEDEGLTDAEFRFLARVSLNFETNTFAFSNSILDVLRVSKPTFYRMVSKLVKLQYLQRDPANGTISLTVSDMRQSGLRIETEESQKRDCKREEESTKEEDKDKRNIESIYNNIILTRDTEKRDIESKTILTDSKENDKEKIKHSAGACAREEPEKPKETERFTEEYREIIAYLNEKTGKRFSATSRVNQGHMSARLKEGFTVEDFKYVIDVKCFQWKDDPKMAKFLRPETLFGTKFDRYLNEEKVQTRVGVYGDVYTVTEEQLNSDVPF